MHTFFRINTVLIISLLILGSGIVLPQKANALSGSQFGAGRIIDDGNFFNSTSMSLAQIQDFLNSKVPSCDTNGTQAYNGTTRAAYGTSKGYPPPYTCLKNYSQVTIDKPFEANLCNGHVAANLTAAEIIYHVQSSCGVSAKVLLVLLQKEQSLVTDDWPWSIQYRSATGYGCPDTAACDAQYYGFFNQVYSAARQFKRYARDYTSFNYRAGRNNYVQYNPNAGCGGTTVFIENQATAGLYNYTPYQPNAAALNNLYGTGDGCSAYGNRNFWRTYNDWFGSTLGPPDNSCSAKINVSGATSGFKLMNYQYAGISRLAFTQQNNTGSGCTEAHFFDNNGFQSWFTHIATGMATADPANGTLVSMKSRVDNQNALTNIIYRGGNGNVEIHRMSPNFQILPGYYDVATNLGGVTATSGMFVTGDFLGRGYDQLVYILYSGGSGRAEIHMFDPTLQQAVGYYDVLTDLSGVSATSGTFVAGDFLGRGYDQLAYVLYNGSGGRAEIHLFNPSLTRAIGYYDVATNLSGVSATSGTFVAGDYLGRRYDQLIYAIYSNGSGRVETHMFNPSLTQGTGFQDIVTALSGFDPAQ